MIEGLRRRFQARRLDAPRSPARFGAHYDPDAFGRLSEGIARFFGTARYLVFQTVMVISWIADRLLLCSASTTTRRCSC